VHPAFPHDAQALIFRPARSTMTSGRAGTRVWRLEFAPRSALWIEPLMGWTASADPLREVSLSFPSREAAMTYARRQGLRFVVIDRESERGPRSAATTDEPSALAA
jgi:hypothetical protein